MSSISENMKFLRLCRYGPISQRELSCKLRIPQTRISNIETGKCYPDLSTVIKYSVFFRISLDYLVFRIYDCSSNQFTGELPDRY